MDLDRIQTNPPDTWTWSRPNDSDSLCSQPHQAAEQAWRVALRMLRACVFLDLMEHGTAQRPPAVYRSTHLPSAKRVGKRGKTDMVKQVVSVSRIGEQSAVAGKLNICHV